MNKLKNIISCYIKVWILGEYHFKLIVFCEFSDYPGVMHKLLSCDQIWINNNCKEVIFVYHIFKTLFQIFIAFFRHSLTIFFLLIKIIFFMWKAFTLIILYRRKRSCKLFFAFDPFRTCWFTALWKITFAELILNSAIIFESTK
jgi:hypothetical protein